MKHALRWNGSPMDQDTTASQDADFAVDLLRHVVVSLVRREGIALSTQQFGVFLACYLCPEAATMRGLVQEMEMPRLIVMRALEKLAELDLIRREPDPRDSRNQILHHTQTGQSMLADLHEVSVGVLEPVAA
ncbi:MAG: helix-turn-helix domain-containing protein [Acetobacteraceae bacterium]|nr:helix-turn-helix domain-containing protein [Acetobacteraceae bacterium]